MTPRRRTALLLACLAAQLTCARLQANRAAATGVPEPPEAAPPPPPRELALAEEALRLEPPDVDRAVQLLDRGCASADAAACALRAELLATEALPSERPRVEELFRRACAGAWLPGCVGLGEWILKSAGPSRFAEAAAAFAQACSAGEPRGCDAELRARVVARARGWAQGAPKTPEEVAAIAARAQQLRESLCADGEQAACRDLAATLLAKPDAPLEHQLAVELLERACAAGDGSACAALGTCALRGCVGAASSAQAETSFRRACALHDGLGCALFAEQRARDGADEEARRYLERACALRSGAGCHLLGQRLAASDPAQAASAHRRACSLRHPAGCTALGRRHQVGDGVAQDYGAALLLYLDVCDGAPWCDEAECHEAIGQACNSAGVAYSQGWGATADAARARAYFERACLLKSAEGCQNLRRPPQ